MLYLFRFYLLVFLPAKKAEHFFIIFMEIQQRKIPDPEKIKEIRSYGINSPYLAQLLYCKGITEKQEIERFLNGEIKDLTDFSLYSDCVEIAERLKVAVAKKEKIVVYGDYDCDGIGATAIYYSCFKKRGAEIDFFIPTRKDDGYGLNVNAIERIQEKFHPVILLTADCGITSKAEVAYAQSLGMEVLITDHHKIQGELPNCLKMNPVFSPELTQYCAAGVAYTVIRAMYGEEEAYRYIDICTISTVADMVPLVQDNRILVKEGLKAIRSGKCNSGLKILLEKTKCSYRGFNTGNISFNIAPKLNAAGRIESAETAVKLLISEDTTEQSLLADNLILQNEERQKITETIFEEAKEQLKAYSFIDHKFIMLRGKWEKGIIGNVCSKLCNYMNMPVILFGEDKGKLSGSARSINGINIFDMLSEYKDRYITFGGHSKAAGLSIREEDFPYLMEKYTAWMQKQPEELFIRREYYDLELPVSKITYDVYRDIARMEPYGEMNDAPVFYDPDCSIKFNTFGRTQSSIKGKYRSTEAIFYYGRSQLPVLQNNPYGLTYFLELNCYQNRETIQCRVKKFYYDSLYLPEIDTLEHFFRTFIPQKPSTCDTNGKKGYTLYICFFQNSVDALLHENPNLPVYCGDSDNLSLGDGIVFIPNGKFPFALYEKAVFTDLYSKKLASSLKGNGMKIERKPSQARFLLKFSVDTEYLRKVYRYYREKLADTKFTEFKKYYSASPDREHHEYQDFLAASYILWEIDLLSFSEEGILKVNTKKVDPETSDLYQFIKEKNA